MRYMRAEQELQVASSMHLHSRDRREPEAPEHQVKMAAPEALEDKPEITVVTIYMEVMEVMEEMEEMEVAVRMEERDWLRA